MYYGTGAYNLRCKLQPLQQKVDRVCCLADGLAYTVVELVCLTLFKTAVSISIVSIIFCVKGSRL